jgi:N6-adenosine-specific RNA methylase IME4
MVVVADPPWKFGDKLPGPGRGAEKHYACMSTPDICAMPHPAQGTDNAVLFLWCVEAMQRDALAVVSSWGFVEKTSLIWEKLTSGGKPHFGMGRIFRASHERCIVAVRGSMPPAVRNIRSRFTAPVGRHSAKPDAFYAIVEALYPDAEKHEMFARTVRAGWLQSGLELEAAQ